jgi:DNA-binding transcriptional LysR family regulator
MDLRELRGFVALSEHQNITRAAEVLHLSPAAVHKQIQMLQEELNAQLYEKVGRRLRLTQAGEVLLPYARDLLIRYQAAIEAFDQWKGVKKGALRLGSGAGISVVVLPKLLSEFSESYPNIEVIVETGSTSHLIKALNEGEVDVAMFVAPEAFDSPGPHVEMVWPFTIVPVASRSVGKREWSVHELRAQPFVLFKEGSQVERSIDAYFSRLDFHPRVVMRFDHAEAIKAIVRIGAGLSMLPRWSVYAELASGELIELQIAAAPLTSRIVLAVRQTGPLPPPVQGLITIARRNDHLLGEL